MRGLITAIVCMLVCVSCGTSTSSTQTTGPTPVEPPTVVDAQPIAQPVDAGPGSTAVTPPVSNGSPSLIKARAQLKKNALFAAHLELFKVLSKETQDTAAGVHEAELLTVKTMYKLKLYVAALAYVRRIVQAAGHPHRLEAITWLVTIARVIPHAATHVPKRLNVNLPRLRSVRDELLLLMARRALRMGQFAFAISFARRVSTTSTHAEPARLIHWEALWRTRKLVAAAKVLQSGFLKGSKFEARANLELARMFWRSKDIRRARKHFSLATAVAKKDSTVFITATFERSLMRLHQRGRLSSLRRLSQADLRRVVYATFCALGPGPDALFPYRATGAKQMASEFWELTKKHADNADLFSSIKAALAKMNFLVKAKKKPSVGDGLAWLSLNDPHTKRAMAFQAELQRELAVMAGADKGWQNSAGAADVLQELTLQNALATADAGHIVRQRLSSANAVAVKLFKLRRRIPRIPVAGRAGRGFHTPISGCPK